MREFSQEGRLNEDVILSIVQEEKTNQKEQFKIQSEKLSRFFTPGTPTQKIESDIIKGLELLQRQRERSRDAR
jgi:ParB family chromosome partitioning protein